MYWWISALGKCNQKVLGKHYCHSVLVAPHLSVRPVEFLKDIIMHLCSSISDEHDGLAAYAPPARLVKLSGKMILQAVHTI